MPSENIWFSHVFRGLEIEHQSEMGQQHFHNLCKTGKWFQYYEYNWLQSMDLYLTANIIHAAHVSSGYVNTRHRTANLT